LLGGVGPRPIALVSTLSADGIPNLAPFSFFNAFGANPPTIGFSPSRRIRDGTVKHTYTNLLTTRECVVQCVTYAMVQQVSLASTEYPEGVSEFVKAGLTAVPSDIVKPARVKESPFQMECRLTKMIELGDGPGSGNLALCEVVKFHIDEELFVDGVIHPDRIDLVARQSANFYARAQGAAVFEVAKPVDKLGIGFDKLPPHILTSHILTANNLAQLANVEKIPDVEEALRAVQELPLVEPSEKVFEQAAQCRDYRSMLANAVALHHKGNSISTEFIERTAQMALECGDVSFAWQALLFLGAVLTADPSTHVK
jgi:flavin reductase (DIM6/NTAB) family NADH-FMN oxidoreductase RutF